MAIWACYLAGGRSRSLGDVVKDKNLALEGLRGIACVNVVLAHFLFSTLGYMARYQYDMRDVPMASWFTDLVAHAPFSLAFNGNSAVCIFFVLSGYVLTAKFVATGDVAALRSAAVRRYVRLVTPAFIAVIFAWIVFRAGFIHTQTAPQWGAAGWVPMYYKDPVSFGAAVFEGAIAAPFFGQVSLNNPLWTMRIELMGSLLLFAVHALFGGRSRVLLVLWFAAFAALLMPQSIYFIYMLAIVAGSLLHDVEAWLRRHPAATIACIVLGLIGCSYEYSSTYAWLNRVPLPNMLPFAVDLNTDTRGFWNTVGAVLLVAGVLGSPATSRFLGWAPFAWLGRISFSLYLLHWPLNFSLGLNGTKFFLDRGLPHNAALMAGLAVFLVVCFLAAEIFQRLVDGPSIRLARYVDSWMARSSPKAA